MSNAQTATVIEMGFCPKKILVPIDGSANSTRAVEVATAIAKSYGGELFLLMVVPMELQSTGPPEGPVYEFSKETGDRIFYDVSKIPKSQEVSVSSRVIRSPNSIVDGIIEYATGNGMDLIVIGTRGLSGFRKLVLGSVSDGVVRHAHCNVLVVR